MKTILEERSCFTLNEIQLSTGANQHQVSCLKLKQKLLDELAECDLFAPRDQHNKAEAQPDQVPLSIESNLKAQHQQQDLNQVDLLSKEKEEQQKLEKEDHLIEDQKEVAESGAREPVRGEMEIIENQAPSERIARQESQHCERLNATTTTTSNQNQKHQYLFQHQLQAQTKSTGLYQAPTTPAASQPKTHLISSSQNQRHDISHNHNHQHLINHSNKHHHHQDHHQRHHHYRQHSQPLPPTPPSSPVLLQVPQAPPKIYPNNTLVEDLTRCHDNLLPKITRATARTIELFRSCLPNKLSNGTGCIGSSTSSLNNGICGKRAKKPKDELAGKQQNGITSAGYINNSIVLTQDDDDSDQSNCDNSPAQARLGPAKVVQAQAGPARARRRTRRAGREKKFQMPDSIVRLNSSLNQDDYNRALSILTNDVRYQLHLLLYRRLQTIWTLFTTILCILIPILCLAHLETFVILGACLLWLSLQATGALVTQQFCKKLDQMLEKAVAQVNSYFMDHNLMLGVINVGGMLTKARLVIPLLYFDTIQCREQIESIISVDLRKESDAGDKEQQQQQLQQLEQRQTTKGQNVKRERKFALDYSKIGLRKIGPENQMSFAQSQLAKKIILRYSQRWISYFDKRKLMFNDDQVEPRHLSTGKCLCQFIEEHFKYDELDLDEAGGDSANNNDDCAQQQEQQQEQHSEALAKVVVAGEQEAERDCGADVEQQSKELAALRTRSRLVNTPNGNPIRQLDSQLHAALNLVTSTESRKITPLGALSLQQNRHANNLASSSQLDMLVPTLSHLVDMKERQEQFKISMDIGFAQESTAQQEQANNTNPSYPSKLIHGFTTHLQQERLDSNSPPTTEHSFDLNTDAGELLLTSSNSNNDELLKRLKSLLESRKNEFSRGLVDGNHLATNITSQYNNSSNSSTSNCVSTYAGRSPQMTSANGNKSIRTQDSNSGSTQTVNQSDEANSGGGGSRISRLGKKFFSQADGIFFLGAKKSQQGVYAKQQQVLEIC